LLYAASIRAIGDIQFRGDFLMGKDKYPISTDWFVQDR